MTLIGSTVIGRARIGPPRISHIMYKLIRNLELSKESPTIINPSNRAIWNYQNIGQKL